MLRSVHVYRRAKFGENISNGGRVFPIFRLSKWRPAAILDFIVAQSDLTGRCRLSMAMSTPNFVKISEIAAELWRFSCFKMAVGRHLGFCYQSKMALRHVVDCPCTIVPNLVTISQTAAELLRFSVFQNGDRCHLEFTSGVDFGRMTCFRLQLFIFLPNFVTVTQPAAQLLSFVEKFKLAAYAILNLYLAILDHPRSPLVDLKSHSKFGVNRTFTFTFFANLAQNAVNTRFEPSLVTVGCAVRPRPRRWAKSTKNVGVRPDAPGEPIFTKCCVRVHVLDLFHSYEFQKDRKKNVGAVGCRNFPYPIEKAHCLYNSLLLPHKPWLEMWGEYRKVVGSQEDVAKRSRRMTLTNVKKDSEA